ncbi:arginine--tRNA ligase [Marinicrinis lubricantis]|uniref:Arginine--tRNA ligase n=1 Tax=Marinicrinis lubricantis TaxID=2086470 RepID=A0ABW1IVD0_9BACL
MNVLEKVKNGLKDEIMQAVVKAGWVEQDAVPEIHLEVPKEKGHGDFSTNIAMQLTRIAKSNPRSIAEQIVGHIQGEKVYVEKVDIAGPGFINFYMNKQYLHKVIEEVRSAGEGYGRSHAGKGERVQVEFVSANPTGSLHLGHARGAAVGDALCNLLDFAGYDVSREYYINDAGNQVLNLAASIEARYLQALGKEAEMPEDGYYGEDIKGFAQELAAEKGDSLLELPAEERTAFFRSYGLEKELAKIKRDLARFGVHFDVWYSETSLYETGKTESILQELKEKGQTFEEEGATWLRTTPYGDDKDRVLIKNDGSFTYLTPDIAYHKDKFERGFDRLINIWGADHHGYVPRMKAAMQALGYEPDRLVVLIAQMVSLYQDGEKVKMSKRTGKAVTLEDLMDEVGVDATRYFFTMRSTDSHLDFDMDLAVSKSNENPVYYVQYAHARICSIFRQAAEQGIDRVLEGPLDLSLLSKESEFDLLDKLAQFSEEITAAAEQLAPHRIVRYIYELASQFHSYYKAERVITDDTALTQARLALLDAVRTVLVNGLKLIGVSAPEQM